MRLLLSVLAATALGLWHHAAAAKAVFAHFMVDNAVGWSQDWWESEMVLAATANIDAFALNIAAGSSTNTQQLDNAFSAANARNFKLFFSFDYAGNGAWAKADVLSLLSQYAHAPAYFQHLGSKPLVSTFEGPDSAADWVEIKRTTGCFFIPDWSSKGAGPALALEGGVADGLFSWAAWSWGGANPDTYTDASYIQDLNGKPYMMAASPWFYTNLPGYSKNWMWPVETMTLWPQRWNQILAMDPQPDYVEIISWNDFGESHYIGTEYSSPPFETDGLARFDYVTGMGHDQLRWPLAVWAAQYKNQVATVEDESIVLMYMLHDISCNDGDTVINTASQLQFEFLPIDILGSRFIGYTATLTSPANLTITVGGHAMAADFIYTPPGSGTGGGAGVYYGFVSLDDGVSGDVSATVHRNGASVVSVTGKPIGGCTADGYANFNLNVEGDIVDAVSPTNTVSLADLVCVQGTGAQGFHDICFTSCQYGYCPYSACVCTALGKQKTLPTWKGTQGYARSDTNYIGLCSFVYPYGFTFPQYCDTVQHTLTTPSVSPFLPYACTSGVAAVDWEDYALGDLCTWLCAYGYCPIRLCSCLNEGDLLPLDNVVVPDDTSDVLMPAEDNMTLDNMCLFACNFGNCVCYDIFEDETPACDFTLTFDSLDALLSAAPSYSDYCNTVYALDVLSVTATAVLANYTTVNQDYDELFDYYQLYVYDMVPGALNDFMWNGGGLSYFRCVWTDSSGSSVKDCPNTNELGLYGSIVGDVTVDMSFSNETGFWDVLADKYGVEKGWVEFVALPFGVNCVNNQVGYICQGEITVNAYPERPDSINITNPKDVFVKAGPGLNGLPLSIDATTLDIVLGQWNGSVLDPVQVFALPIAMAQQAVDAMAQVKSIGQTEEDEEKQEIIGFIVMAVLSLIPMVGEEIAAAVDIAQIARAATLAGAAGDLGYSIYSVVQDPNSAPMTIIGMLFGVGGFGAAVRDAGGFSQLAKIRRGIGADELGAMGTIVKDQATKLQKITKSCDM